MQVLESGSDIPVHRGGIPPARGCSHEAQFRVLELIARAEPLDKILDSLCREVDSLNPNLVCGICFFDHSNRCVGDLVSPGLPGWFLDAAKGTPLVKPAAMPCMQVVETGEPLIIHDVENDPTWSRTPWAAQVTGLGFHQFRSIPIHEVSGPPLASFALFSRVPSSCEPLEENFHSAWADLAKIAIRRHIDQSDLQEKAEHLRLAVESAELGTWDWDVPCGMCRPSQRAATMLGLDPGSGFDRELLSKRLHPEDVDPFWEALSKAGSETTGFEMVFRVRDRGDGFRYFLTKGGAFPSEHGSKTVVRGVLMDITSRKEAELALARTEQTLRLAVEATGIGLWDWDPEMGTGDPDQKCREIFGGHCRDYASWVSLLHPEDKNHAVKVFEDALGPEGTGHFSNEYRIVLPDGEVRWVGGFGAVIYSGEGPTRKPLRVIGANLDITASKRAQMELAAREEKFRMMADATPVLIWLMNARGACTYFNRRWLEFTGRNLEMELGEGWSQGVHPEDLSASLEIFRSALLTKTPFQMHYRLRRFDGEYRWLLDRGEPVFDSEGGFQGFIGGCVDIQDHKELEARLRESEERSRLAVESGGMGFWDWDLSGRAKWSPEFQRLLGIPSEYKEGLMKDILDRVCPEDRTGVFGAIQKALENKGDFAMEFRTASGSRWLSASGRVFPSSESATHGRMLGVVRDITHRMESEKKIHAQQAKLREALELALSARREAELANSAKDQFLAALSHELRTPLTPVLMALSILRMDPDIPEKQLAILNMIQRNIRSESRLIDDLLDFTRISRQAWEVAFQPVNLHKILQDALSHCSQDFGSKTLSVEVHLNAVEHTVLGDTAKLMKIFEGLFKNSAKFTPEGGSVRINSWNEEQKVSVSIQDTGLGISPDMIERIFNPFEQGSGELVRKFGGLGLGLAIARASAIAHGGSLTGQSEGPGLGAMFTLTLPIHS